MGLVWNHFEKLLMDESEAANDRSNVVLHFFRIRCWIVIFSNQRLVVFSSCCSIPSVGHLTLHYFGFVGVCLVPPFLVSFRYFMGQRWNNNWQQALACQWYTNRLLEGCHSRRWEWVTITFSGRIKKSFKVFLLFSLWTYFILTVS